MAKGKKSVALFEVITAQQGKRTEQRVPRPSFWKRLGLRKKAQADLERKATTIGQSAEDAELQRRKMEKAAALKAAQERAAARAAKKARAEARAAERKRKKDQRDAKRAERIARTAAVEDISAEPQPPAPPETWKPRPARNAGRSAAAPAETPVPGAAPLETSKAVDAPDDAESVPAVLRVLRETAKIEAGRLVLSFDWLTGSLAAAVTVLLVLAGLATGVVLTRGEAAAGESQTAAADPLADLAVTPEAADLSGAGEAADRIRPADDAPAQAFRFLPEPNYIVVLTVPSRLSAERSRRFLASRGVEAVVVPVGTESGPQFEVVCTEGVRGVSDPRCKELAAEIRRIGKVFAAPPHQGGTDFGTLYLKKGVHYQ